MSTRRTTDAIASILRVAGWSLILAAIVAVIGIVFLALMYGSFAAGIQRDGERFGSVNDILVVVQYLLMLPAIGAAYVLGRERWPGRSLAVALAGVVLVALIVVLQGLLIGGAMTFEQQIGPLSVMLVLLAVWFVALGWLVTALGVVRHGIALGVVAATYLGFPVWAFVLGRALRDRAGRPSSSLATNARAL
jgi:hypothetical protein